MFRFNMEIDEDYDPYEAPTRYMPERALCAAILARSLQDLTPPITDKPWENRHIIRRAINFFECRELNPTHKFSFLMICDYLELDYNLVIKYAKLEPKIKELSRLIKIPPEGIYVRITDEDLEETKQTVWGRRMTRKHLLLIQSQHKAAMEELNPGRVQKSIDPDKILSS